MSSITTTYNGTTTSNNIALMNEGQIVTYTDLNNIGVRRFVQNSNFYNNLFGDDAYGVINGLKVAERSTDLSGAGVTILSGSIAVTAGAAKLGLITSDLYSSPHSIICKLDSNYNDISIDIGDPDYPRIDLIACRAREYSTNNTTVAKRTSDGVLTTDVYDIDFGASVNIHYIKGTPNSSPVKPTVNSSTTDIILAYIYVPAACDDVASCTITDVRHILYMNGVKPSCEIFGTVDLSGSATYVAERNNSNISFISLTHPSGTESLLTFEAADEFDDMFANIIHDRPDSFTIINLSGSVYVTINNLGELSSSPGVKRYQAAFGYVDYMTATPSLPPIEYKFKLELLPIKYD